MSKVTVFDYGAGNLLNVVRALEHVGAEVHVTSNASDIQSANRLILPGVGAFGDSMAALQKLGVVDALKKYITDGKLFLGICVGMQVMFEVGEEFGSHPGLGIIKGKVSRIPCVGADGKPHKIPHIGWSPLKASSPWAHTMLAKTPEGTAVYFVHSYRCVPENKADMLAEVEYNGVPICAAIHHGNAYGCQFHPEKSAELGLDILRAFMALPA